MRKILGFILDLIFLLGLWGFSLLIAIVFILKRTADILELLTKLEQNFDIFLAGTYAFLLILALIYFVFIPLFLRATPGQYIAGLGLVPAERVNLWSLFLRFLGGIIDIVLLPISLILALLGKVTFAARMSGLYLTATSRMLLTRIFIFLLCAGCTLTAVYAGNFAIKHPHDVVTKFIDYKKYVRSALILRDYETVLNLLDAYKQKYGEDKDYDFFKCVALAHLGRDNAEDVCSSLELAKYSKDDQIRILLAQIKIADRKGNLKEKLDLYRKLWDKYGYRGPEMLEYIKLVASQDERTRAVSLLKEWLRKNPVEKLKPSVLLSVGEIYFQLGEYDKAILVYKYVLNKLQSKLSKASVYFRIGECYYQKGDTSEALKYFSKAKALDKNYTNLVESYIIDMKLKKQ